MPLFKYLKTFWDEHESRKLPSRYIKIRNFNKHETLFQSHSIKALKLDQARQKKNGQKLHTEAGPELHLFYHYTKIRDAGIHTDLMKILRDVEDIIKQVWKTFCPSHCCTLHSVRSSVLDAFQRTVIKNNSLRWNHRKKYSTIKCHENVLI